MRGVAVLTGVGLALWVVLLGPAWLWYGQLALLQSATAFVLCFVPGVVTMLAAQRLGRRSGDLQILAALGGSGVRMAVALGVGAFLYFQYPAAYTAAFWGWVLVFYIVFLTVEVTFLLRSDQAAGNQTKASC
jgi:hypothetical protein